MAEHIRARDITILILAGGRGARMGGVDKGLQLLNGVPLVEHTLARVRDQAGAIAVNANRNLSRYEALGVPVWADGLADYAGPLAGFLTGLEHCDTPWMATVPCDSPLLPSDLIARLAQGAGASGSDIAMAAAPEAQSDGLLKNRAQPVFCLLRCSLRDSLNAFTQAGGRKIDAWTAQHKSALVAFDRSTDDPLAFFNANTLAELSLLETRAPRTSQAV